MHFVQCKQKAIVINKLQIYEAFRKSIDGTATREKRIFLKLTDSIAFAYETVTRKNK